jgi:hypothetical protein
MERTDGRAGAAARLPADQVHAGGGGRLDRRRPWQRLPAVEDVWRRAGLEARTLTILAEADAFAALGPDPARGALGRARAGAEGGAAAFAGDLDGEGIVEC